MATSAALNYALSNGISKEQYYQNIFDYVLNNQNLTDAQLKAEMTRLGVSPQDVAAATGVPVAGVEQRFNAATPVTANASTMPTYFQQNPDVAAAYQVDNYGLTPAQFADTHYQLYGQYEQRVSPSGAPAIIRTPVVTTPTVTPPLVTTPTTVTPPLVTTPVVTPPAVVTPPVVRPPVTPPVVTPPPVITVPPVTTPPVTGSTTTKTNTGSALPYFQLNPDVAAAYLTNNYGLTPEQFAAAHYSQYGQFEQRTAPSTSPFANATQGFQQNFQNYQSIPIGSQYNPNVVGGTGSPYSQIMGQMRPAGPFNPYMGVASNTPMGGYDPALYDRIAANNALAKLAAGTGTAPAESGGGSDSGGDSGSSPGGQGGDAAGNTGGGPGTGADGDAAFAKGGMVRSLLGPDPQGPDDGMGYLDKGEYVIKKSSVKKYGRGLLDMINEGKVPAKKIRSLLD
jgi:hypothetical protein